MFAFSCHQFLGFGHIQTNLKKFPLRTRVENMIALTGQESKLNNQFNSKMPTILCRRSFPINETTQPRASISQGILTDNDKKKLTRKLLIPYP